MQTTLSTDAKVFRLTTGTRESWSDTVTDGFHVGPAPDDLEEVTNIEGDLTVGMQMEDYVLQLKGRRSKAHVATLSDSPIEFQIVHDPTNADWAAFNSAHINRANIALAFLSGDQATVGVEGYWADWTILDFSRPEKISGILMNTIKLAPGLSDVELERVKVSA